jgi:hypothetical protein
VHLCIQQGGGHLQTLYTKKWNYVKKVKHHSKLCRAKIDINYL